MAIRTLSAAYFVGEILIPNISGTSTQEQANLLPLQIAMAKYEPMYLKMLLGEDLFTAYVAGIAAGSPDAKWVTLNNMIYYTDAALTAAGTGISPVADYVYFYYQRSQATLTLTNSEVKAAHENFTVDSPAEKMIAAWNDMVRLSGEIQSYIIDNDYPEFFTSKVQPTVFTRINSFGI
jgi:hypothetical protein